MAAAALGGRSATRPDQPRVILWGLRRDYRISNWVPPGPGGITRRLPFLGVDSFCFIHAAYEKAFRWLGHPCLWLPDHPSSARHVKPGDVVFCVDVASRHLPVRPGLLYIAHNLSGKQSEAIAAAGSSILRLQVLLDGSRTGRAERINDFTYLDRDRAILYQPWGTHLTPDEFLPPAAGRGRTVWWIGSVWDNADKQGNRDEYGELGEALSEAGLRLRQSRASDRAQAGLVRASRIVPAIQGRWQVENGYIPCRAFKNISFGRTPFVNSRAVADLLGLEQPRSLHEAVASALAWTDEQERRETMRLQALVRAEHTTVQRAAMVLQAASDLGFLRTAPSRKVVGA